MFESIEPFSLVWVALLHSATVIGVLLTLLLISQILRSRRIPSASMGWLLVIIFLPVIGIPLYLTFGERKLKTRIKQKGQLDLPDTPDNYGHSMNALLISLGIPSASGGNFVRFHEDGVVAWQALLELLEGAQQSIDIAIFILADDRAGRKILSLLEDKVTQGVKVRLLLDGVGSFWLPKKSLLPLARHGGQIAWFIPVFHRPLRGRTNLRNHRKMIIVDHEKVWSGGRNLVSEYFAPDSANNRWIDLSFTQQGSVVSTYGAIFDADWHFATHTPMDNEAEISRTQPKGESRVQIIPSGPDVADDPIYAAILMACYTASQRIMIVTPYYVPDTGLQEALKLAALRGVVVDMMLPEKSNHGFADIARSRYLRELAKAGVRIWFLLDSMVHAKALVIDHSFAMAGSANLDIRSLFFNCEVMSGFYSDVDIQWLANWLEVLRDRSVRHHPQPVGAFREMLEGLTLLGAYQL